MSKKKKQEEVTMTESVVLENELESIQKELDIARMELTKTRNEIEEKKHELSSLPRRELDANEIKIQEKMITQGNERNSCMKIIEQQKAYDNVKVTGKFINRRAPGQMVKLTYMKYADDPVKWYQFEDGKVYTIPRGFADQINEYYHTPRFIQKEGPMDPNAPASQIHEIDTSNKKYAFVPVNF